MTSRQPLRLAGAEWRLLAHTVAGQTDQGETWYGDSHHIASDRRLGGGEGKDYSVDTDDGVFWSRHTELPGTEFDELVVGQWLHIEQMDHGTWWMNVGGVTLWVTADRDGHPTTVTVFGPDEYAGRVPGVTYECSMATESAARPIGATNQLGEEEGER